MPVEKLDDDTMLVLNDIDDNGGDLRIERVRGVLHVGVVTRSYGTHWADINIDSLLEALTALGAQDQTLARLYAAGWRVADDGDPYQPDPDTRDILGWGE